MSRLIILKKWMRKRSVWETLVDDLIILSRFDAGQAEIGTEEIDLIRFVNNLIETYRYKYGE